MTTERAQEASTGEGPEQEHSQELQGLLWPRVLVSVDGATLVGKRRGREDRVGTRGRSEAVEREWPGDGQGDKSDE